MFRYLPHKSYGNYGGRKARCMSNSHKVCPLPIDSMDKVFARHDTELREANLLSDPKQRKRATKQADINLYQGLKKVKNKDLAHPVYGRIYKTSALAVFGLASGELKRKGFGFKWLKKF